MVYLADKLGSLIVLSGRPRVRLQSPVIVFNASAVLGQQKDLNHNGRVDPYLPSGQPAPENILAPLTVNDPTDGPIPSLSSLRLHRIRPFIEDTRFEPSALSVHVPNPFPALPAIASHIRHHKCERSSARPELIAALNLEIAPFSEDNVVIVKVEMHLADGKAVDLGQGQAPKLPLECRPQDNVVFLYRLTLDQPLLASGNSNTTKTLDVSIDAIGLSSKKCRPRIKMQWTTSVDFSEALNPTYGTPQQSMQRANRPSSLNFPAASVPVGITNRVRPVTQDAATSSQTGVSITFSAPAEVHIHEDFIIEILVVNNSSQAKRLTVSAISQESKKALGEGHKVLPTSQSGLQHQDGDVAEAFIREDALFASLQTAKGHTPEVLALSAAVELRYETTYEWVMGIWITIYSLLEPGSCYSTQMTYVALAVGHLQVGPVRVTDAASNTSIDVHDMPTVVAVQRPGGSVEQERHSNS